MPQQCAAARHTPPAPRAAPPSRRKTLRTPHQPKAAANRGETITVR